MDSSSPVVFSAGVLLHVVDVEGQEPRLEPVDAGAMRVDPDKVVVSHGIDHFTLYRRDGSEAYAVLAVPPIGLN